MLLDLTKNYLPKLSLMANYEKITESTERWYARLYARNGRFLWRRSPPGRGVGRAGG